MISYSIASFAYAPQQKISPDINALSIRNLRIKTLVASNGGEILQSSLLKNRQRTENIGNNRLLAYLITEKLFYALQ
jgi:hypothetical protein